MTVARRRRLPGTGELAPASCFGASTPRLRALSPFGDAFPGQPLRRGRGILRRELIGQVVGLSKPVRDGRFDFVAMPDVHEVHDLRLRRAVYAPDLRCLDRPAEEQAELERLPLRTDEEVTGFAREHDRLVRRVDTLVAERGRGF